MIRVDRGDARDVPLIMAIMESAFDPKYGEAWTSAQCLSTLSMPYSQLWLAYFGENLAGFAISRWILDEEEILMIGVSPDHQGKSVGKGIVTEIMSQARDASRKKLFLEVRDGNGALNFYKNAGFEEFGRRRKYYRGIDGVRYDAITMHFEIE